MVQRVYGAVDIGASGGRVIAGLIEDGRVRLDVVHRFDNQVSERDGSLSWDIRGLFAEVLTGLSALANRYPAVISIGIDTWAVDYGLLDGAGELIGDPVAYRDDRTLRQAQGASSIDHVHDQVSAEELYALTGLQFLPFNTIYQLAAEQQSERWANAETALLLPDLLAYWLTGERHTEATNASTTGLFDATARDWSETIMDKVGIPVELFPPVVRPGTVVGSLLPEIARTTGLDTATVVTAVGSHDTASAVVAVPSTGRDIAYISSGTWSLVGVELDTPILSEASRAANFTNEGGVDDRVRYLRNAGGLWLLSECLREWRADGAEIDLGELITAAGQELGDGPQVDVDAEEFIAPGQMPKRIAAALQRTGQVVPSTRAGMTRCILESLATAYAKIVGQAGDLSGRRIEVVHVVGGGSQNELLCQLTADRCGLPVVAGPVEATALGNVLVQARADGAVSGTLEDLRVLVAESADLTRYEPHVPEPVARSLSLSKGASKVMAPPSYDAPMTSFRYHCPLRWGDMDAQAHINNATYLDYLQEARVEFLLSGPEAMAEMLNSGVLVVSHQVEYLAPVEFSTEPLVIELWVDLIQGARFRIGYAVLAGEQVVARARTVAVPFDLAAGSLRRLSAAERDYLQSFRRDAEDLRDVPHLTWSDETVAHSYPLRVRWSDLDSYGHANNVKFFDYLQEGRIAAMAGIGPEELWLLVRQDVEYVRPLDFRREPYEVRTATASVGGSSVTLAVQLRDPETGTVYATGRSVAVCADLSGRPNPFPSAPTALGRYAA